ncbi:hypothetical protein ACFSTE_07210 [Aquimarina hainanensis]|uniref:tRNA modification GTPase n=1 Tax=Aquimarina hainanensis TaxID=1578017 RepID=A0ABW5N8V1_9FLAO|nr:hypothetical protein [Aquimarina sp. TRL1]QKX05032.1 hypothetical protein HN014_08920 [Aquimarina sp. TRL1]
MKLLTLCIVTFFFSVTISAQSLYEAGYFIDNDGNKTKCLIKKLPWKNTPTSFEWKKNISSSTKTGDIEDIREFGVGQDFVFKRYILEFDLAGDNLGRATKSKDPNVKIRKIYLRQILQSKASLFQYSKNGVHRFFYTNGKTFYPELLVYKVYYTPDESKKVGEKIIHNENTKFREQLKKYINCGNQETEMVTYTLRSLLRYFKEYNQCKGAKIDYIFKRKISQTKIGVVAGIDFNEFSHPSHNDTSMELLYEITNSARYGLFIETFIPFSKVDLSFFLEGTYTTFSSTATDPIAVNTDYTLDYQSLSFALAPRFHIYLSSTFELFFEGGVSANFHLDTTSDALEEVKNSTTNYFYGGGLGTGRVKMGYRIYTSKNISRNLSRPDSDLHHNNIYISVALF